MTEYDPDRVPAGFKAKPPRKRKRWTVHAALQDAAKAVDDNPEGAARLCAWALGREAYGEGSRVKPR